MQANHILYCAGSMGYWKTMLATIMTTAQRYQNVYANYPITWLENMWKKYKQMKHFSDIEALQTRDDKERKWVLIIDEVNINLPNTGYMSKQNTEVAKFWVLSRKANIDIILTWVDFFSMDVRFRRIVHTLFNMEHPKTHANWIDLNFQKRQAKTWEFTKEKWHILVWYMVLEKANTILEQNKIRYDTTATARLF